MPLSLNTQENTVAVIGAGTMGSGIAHKYAIEGFSVIVIDKEESALIRSKSGIEKSLNLGVEKGTLSKDAALATLERLSWSSDLGQANIAHCIIEAIFEDLILKKKLFSELENICSKETIFATNTSSFLVADLQADLIYKERFLGLHYFFPPARNRLVEVIATNNTHPEVLAHAKALQESIHKVAINSKDSPGFIVNRFFVPWLNESMRIMSEGVANIATVEQAAKDTFKIGMGPFTLMNVTGLPITFHAANSLASYLGPFYAPCPIITAQMETKQPWQIAGSVDHNQLANIGLRLLAVVTAVANRMVHDEQVCSEQDADMAARVGLAWEKGPFELFSVHKPV